MLADTVDSITPRYQHRCSKRIHGFEVLGQAVTFLARVDDHSAYGFEVGTGGMKTTFQLGRQAAFDLYGLQLVIGPAQQQVDFCAATAPVEISVNAFRRTV